MMTKDDWLELWGWICLLGVFVILIVGTFSWGMSIGTPAATTITTEVPQRYEVEVIEAYEDESGVYIVSTHNYMYRQIWILYTEQFEYEVGDVLTVIILKISDGMNDTLAIPYIEYMDETIDGKVFGMTEACGGVCWYYDRCD